MTSSYIVLDLETGSKEQYKRPGNPFTGDNKIVAIATCSQGDVLCLYKDDVRIIHWAVYLQPKNVLVGHNIKYDLLYLWRDNGLEEWLKEGGIIWDTALVEYYLTAQQHKFPKLRNIAVNKYGCKEREKLMEGYWSKGVDTGDIPKEVVIEDVRNDVLDTEQVYLKQVQTVRELGIYPLIETMNKELLATTEMECNGMFVERDILNRDQEQLERSLEETAKQFDSIVKKYWVPRAI